MTTQVIKVKSLIPKWLDLEFAMKCYNEFGIVTIVTDGKYEEVKEEEN